MKQHKLAQHHRHGDVGASPFGSWEIPSLKRALHSLHVLLLLPCREAQSVKGNRTSDVVTVSVGSQTSALSVMD